jgi:protein-S-isoprenylcysteine O-methyltransferase Ste14
MSPAPQSIGQSIRQSIYDVRQPSHLQRAALAITIAACVALTWWLLIGGGVATLGTWCHLPWQAGNPVRRLVLVAALSIYFVRLLFTQFVFLKRALGWSEAATVGIWVACIYLLLALAGGTNGQPPALFFVLGSFFFLLGSWMNTWAEYTRHLWKQQPENRDRLYTVGLFRLCRHPNYLGDLISFSGLALMAGRWIAGVIPAIMLLGFVFVNIPMLDAHLADRYGAEFAAYARRTRKLFPFLY